MEKEIKKKGRQPGVSYKKESGYISINKSLRIRVETDNLTIEESVGKDDNGNELWGNNRYFTSWEGIIKWLVRRFTTEKISKKELLTFTEAKNEILNAIKEIQVLLIGEIENQMKSASSEVKNSIVKFNR